jgi:hypothetical protein
MDEEEYASRRPPNQNNVTRGRHIIQKGNRMADRDTVNDFVTKRGGNSGMSEVDQTAYLNRRAGNSALPPVSVGPGVANPPPIRFGPGASTNPVAPARPPLSANGSSGIANPMMSKPMVAANFNMRPQGSQPVTTAEEYDPRADSGMQAATTRTISPSGMKTTVAIPAKYGGGVGTSNRFDRPTATEDLRKRYPGIFTAGSPENLAFVNHVKAGNSFESAYANVDKILPRSEAMRIAVAQTGDGSSRPAPVERTAEDIKAGKHGAGSPQGVGYDITGQNAPEAVPPSQALAAVRPPSPGEAAGRQFRKSFDARSEELLNDPASPRALYRGAKKKVAGAVGALSGFFNSGR